MGALDGLGGQILDTFVKSEAWGGGPGAEGTGVLEAFPGLLGSPGGSGGELRPSGYLDLRYLDLKILRP